MAFVANKDLPEDPIIGKKFRNKADISNMSGIFQQGTLLTCIDANTLAIWLADEFGNKLYMNRASSLVSLELID